MAGDIQEPFRLNFQVDSLHSGSISFGRFELESLSWERRSSFSHNRHMEEVHKYVIPGSVTEKKAYLEAHFRQKSLLRQASSSESSQAEKEGSNCENGSCDTVTYEDQNDSKNQCNAEEPQDIHQSSDVSCHFDESLEDCDYPETGENIVDVNIMSHFDESTDECDSQQGVHLGGEFEGITHSDLQLETAENSSVDHLETVVRCCDHSEEKFVCESQCNDVLTDDNVGHDVEVEMIPNGQAPEFPREEEISHFTEATDSASKILQSSAQKSRAEEKSRTLGVRSRPQSSVSLTGKPEVKRASAQGSGWRERETPLRMRTQNQIKQMPLQLNGSTSLQSSLRILKKESPRSLKGKPPQEIRSEKDLRSKRGVTLQPSTPERTETRRHPSAAGTKKIVPINREIKRCAMNSSFRSERGEKTKEIKQRAMNSSFMSERGQKMRQEKKEAETRQVAKKPNFKAKPMPSFYHENTPQGSSKLAPSKSSRLGNQTGGSSILSSRTGNNNQAIIPPSKSEGSRASLARRICDTRPTFGARCSSNQIAKASQTKVVVIKPGKN